MAVIQARRVVNSWTRVTGSRTWVAGVNDLATTSHLPSGNNEMIIPPAGRIWAVRGLTVWWDTVDPIVFAGGATSLFVGSVNVSLFTATAASVLPLIWVDSTNANIRQTEAFEVPGDMAIPSGGELDWQVTAAVDLGSVSGTLRWAYEYELVAKGLST